MISKEELRQHNCHLITEAIRTLQPANYETVARLIPDLLITKSLIMDHTAYLPTDKDIGRHLIYDHQDKDHPFSIWVFVFASQQKTPIHDHQFKGTVTVLEGPIAENYYLRTGDDSAQLVQRCNRHRFHTNTDNLNHDFIHQLKCRKNTRSGFGMTLHIYNMEAQIITTHNELIDQRNKGRATS